MPSESMTMTQVMFTSTLLDVVMLVIAFLAVWLMLRFLDHVTGFDFRTWLQEGKCSHGHNTAIAIYLAGRLVGVCLLVGLGLS